MPLNIVITSPGRSWAFSAGEFLMIEDISRLFDLFSLRTIPIVDRLALHVSSYGDSSARSIVKIGKEAQPDTKKITRIMMITIFAK